MEIILLILHYLCVSNIKDANVMLTSLAFIFLLGLLLSSIFNKLKLPGLMGMLLTGMLLGPYVLNLLSPSLLSVSIDLRQLALIIILMRAGLALNIHDLKKVGRPAILMCFVPACFELVGMILIAPKLLDISILDAAIMGTVVAAVSPAIIVPKMLRLLETGYGKRQHIPQMIMAGGSVDDVFVIVLFTVFTGIAAGGGVTAQDFLQIPVAIIMGLLGGVTSGWLLSVYFKRYHLRDSVKVMIILSISFLLVSLEHLLQGIVAFSGLLAVMSLGAVILLTYQALAVRLSAKFSKLWVAAEVLLFVLVGATVDMQYVAASGLAMVVVILGTLCFRMLGVYVSVIGTDLNMKERLFCMIAYLPKATVQAAIGGIPLAMGLPCGDMVLSVAVLAILITAPLGALGIDKSYKLLLNKEL